MTLFNPLTCSGFITETTTKISMNFGACAGARLAMVGLFFLNALVRKWGGEEVGLEYNFWAGLGGAFVAYLIPLLFTGNVKISFVIGIVGMLIGGYGYGAFFGGGDDGGY